MLEEYHQRMQEQGYICSIDAEEFVQSALMQYNPVAQKVAALLLLGPAGAGKTFFAECFAKAIGAEILFYQTHYASGKEEMLGTLDVRGVVERLAGHGAPSDYTVLGVLPQAIEMTKEGPVVLVIDEIDKSKFELDPFFLDFLQSGRIFDPNIGRFQVTNGNLFVIATSNQDRLLIEPLMRRFRRVYMKYPPKQVEMTIICKREPEASIEFVEALIDIASWFRQQEGVMKYPCTAELANAVGDCVTLGDPKHRAMTIVSWFCAYEEDRQILLAKYPMSSWESMLNDYNVLKNPNVENAFNESSKPFRNSI